MTTRILAIDPGSEKSAHVIWDGEKILRKGILNNESFLRYLRDRVLLLNLLPVENLVIEQVRSYGMAVGATVFDTVHWSGRFHEAWYPMPVILMPRMDVKMHLCHSARAKDSNVSRAIKDRYGEPGTVTDPNLVYGEEKGKKESKIRKDMWQALALAITWFDLHAH